MLGEPDDGWHGHHCGRSKRPLGSVEGIVRRGSALAKAMADPGANPLVKALASDFSTSEARSTARDGLKAKFANSQPADVKTKSIEALRQVSAVLAAKQTLTKRSSPISIYELPRTAAFADRFHFVLSAVEITRDFVRRLRES